jgi:hypothetical protein
MTIQTLPSPPLKTDSATGFAASGDAFFGALKTFGDEMQAFEVELAAAVAGSSAPSSALRVPYNLVRSIVDSDPSSGNCRVAGAGPSYFATTTMLYISTTASDGAAMTTLLDSLDDSTANPKGVILLTVDSAPTQWGAYTLTSITTATGYRKLALVPLFAGEELTSDGAGKLHFFRKGDQAAFVAAQGNKTLKELRGLDYNARIAATTAINWTSGHIQNIAGFSGGSITMTSPGANPCRLILQLPAAGSPTTITWPAAVKWLGASFTQQTTNKTTIIYLTWDGTSYWSQAYIEV